MLKMKNVVFVFLQAERNRWDQFETCLLVLHCNIFFSLVLVHPIDFYLPFTIYHSYHWVHEKINTLGQTDKKKKKEEEKTQ